MGLLSKKKKDEVAPDEITPEVKDILDEFCWIAVRAVPAAG